VDTEFAELSLIWLGPNGGGFSENWFVCHLSDPNPFGNPAVLMMTVSTARVWPLRSDSYPGLLRLGARQTFRSGIITDSARVDCVPLHDSGVPRILPNTPDHADRTTAPSEFPNESCSIREQGLSRPLSGFTKGIPASCSGVFPFDGHGPQSYA
jgi:hypothetical protein